jgi:hypothetical protein
MDDEHRPYTIERAWEDLHYAVDLLLGFVGLPGDLARMRLVRRVKREDILVWLAPIEALVRRILLFVALQSPLPNFAPHCSRDLRLRSAMRDTPVQELSEESADWRVLFRVWPGANPRAAKRADAWTGQGGCRASDYNTYPLARRIEALVRVARDPARAIARLARKIAQRRAELWVVFAPYRHRGGPVQTILNEAQAAVDAALSDTS